jgi:N,N'-diacetyllegionaminate synthase
MQKLLTINDRRIGAGQDCFVIAEAGVNHNGNVDTAIQMIHAAAHAGADAVKFQTFKAEKLTLPHAPKAAYQKETTPESESQLNMLRRLELSQDVYPVLIAECRKKSILFMSTPFDDDSANFLDGLGMSVFKISSGEITNLPFLVQIARKGKPVILSTGMSYLSEVDIAVRAIRAAGNQQLALLHCTSVYPANPADINLRAMNTMEQAFQAPVGFSDHSLGIEIPLAAVAMGASIIEKHFTLDRSLPGPDQQASLEPGELENMVKGIRKVEAALGNGCKEPVELEADTANVARKSLVSCRQIPAGSVLSESDVVMMRPGTGLPPAMLEYILGRTTRVDIPAGRLIALEMFE